MMNLNFEDLRRLNVSRSEQSFHAINEWSPTDWATAVAGELGEACNLIKKLRRATGPTMESGKANTPNVSALIPMIAQELADAIIYIDLLAARLNIDLSEAVRSKFNEVSHRVGSTVTL